MKSRSGWFITVLALLLFAALLGACTSQTTPEPVQNDTEVGVVEEAEEIEEAETASEKVADEGITVAFIPQIIGIPYYTAMEAGGKRAAEAFGGEFLMVGSTSGSAPEQVRLMENLITQKVDAIGVSPLDAESIKPIMTKAMDEGIEVFTSDADAPDSDRMVYVAQAIDRDLGYILMDRLVLQTGEDAQIGIVSGDPTIQSMANWVKYMQERAETEYPNIEIVDIRYTPGGSSEDSLRQAEELMTLYPDIKGIVGVASTNVPGVSQAVEQAGKSGEIAVIGYGSPNTVRSFIKSGVMKESILWNPEELGYLSYWAALQLIEGNEFKEFNEVPGMSEPVQYLADEKILLLGEPLVIDANNVDDFDF